MRIGIIREINCVFDKDSEVEFFKTGENEETVVLKTDLTDSKRSEAIPLDLLQEIDI
jgi:hypothetical protein